MEVLERYVNLETIDDFCVVNPESPGLGRVENPKGSLCFVDYGMAPS